MRLRYTRRAFADLASILDHVAAASPMDAARGRRRIKHVDGFLVDPAWAPSLAILHEIIPTALDVTSFGQAFGVSPFIPNLSRDDP
jgi:hypothetical protein